MSSKKKEKQTEVEENAKCFFSGLKRGEYDNFIGKYALMKNREIVEYYDTKDDARRTGALLYKDGLFSIQKVEKETIDLGYFSHATF